jgi:hypothetical protein
MICPFCKEEIKDGAIKCKHCGSMLTEEMKTATALFCKKCGAENNFNSFKCIRCGEILHTEKPEVKGGIEASKSTEEINKINTEKKLKKKVNPVVALLVIIIATIAISFGIYDSTIKSSSRPIADKEDKSEEIAKYIQDTVNVGGFNGCSARASVYQMVWVDMRFPAGTERYAVEANTSGVADRFAKIGLAANIYYTGYSGNLKVCEYKYDMYLRTVIKQNN